METRTLRIWDGDKNGCPALDYNEEYEGSYLEDYETSITRIGMIFDAVKTCVVVFRQVIKSRDDPRPTDIVRGIFGPKAGVNVLNAWSTDPQYADPPGRNASCIVWDFIERKPTEEDNKRLAYAKGIDKPPTGADKQRWREEKKAKQRRAEAEEAVIRLATKAFTKPHANTSLPKSPCRAYSQHLVMVGTCDLINIGKLRPEDEDCIAQQMCGFLIHGPAMAEDVADIGEATCLEGCAYRIVKVLDVETQKLAVFKENERCDAPLKEHYYGYRATEQHPENEEPKTMETYFIKSPNKRGNEQYANRYPELLRIFFRQPTSVELRMFDASPLVKNKANALSIQERTTIMQNLVAPEKAKNKNAGADIEAHVKNAANKAVNKEIVPIVETLKKAILISTPARDRQWWQNLRAVYDRESAPTEGAKWRAVAHIVVMGANLEIQKPARDRQSNYLPRRSLGTLIDKLRAPGASLAKIETAYADTLRRYVTREEQKAKKPAKSRA